MVLSRPPWPVFLIDFAQNPLLECKQLRDGAHFQINICFQQSNESNFWNFVWVKQWKMFFCLR